MASQQGTFAVHGLTEVVRDFKTLDKPTRAALRASLRDAGDIVKRDATARFVTTDARSAAGYRTRVRQRGVAVEQSIRKTTGKHPEYGALQMRTALVPALEDNTAEVEHEIERALDKVSAGFERRGPL